MNVHPQCPACQGFVSIGGGRCPTCGEMLPDFAQNPSQRPRRGVIARPEESSRSIVPVIILSISVLAAGAAILYWTLGPQTAPQPTASAAPPPMPTASAVAASSFDPDKALSEAWRKARSWHRDAAMVRLELTAVAGGKPEPSAEMTATFGKPSGRLGPGELVGKERYRVKRTLDGQNTDETLGGAAERAAPDPTCPVSAAWRAAVASGLPSEKPMRLSYAYSEKYGRATWQAQLPQSTERRDLDGASCNILAR